MKYETPFKAKNGDQVFVGDTILLVGGAYTVVTGWAGSLLAHTGGFCEEGKIEVVVNHPEHRNALMMVNSSPLTKARPCENLWFPVKVTSKTEMIGGTLHREVIIGKNKHMIDDFNLQNEDYHDKKQEEYDCDQTYSGPCDKCK
jgi:hypothetical protein